jgi:hypothetical protein
LGTEVIGFMDRYDNSRGDWLSSSERLDIAIVRGDLALFRDTTRLDQMLAADLRDRHLAPPYLDSLPSALRKIERDHAPALIAAFDSRGATDIEQRFYAILLNSRVVRGIRAQRGIHELIESLQRDAPASPYTGMARRYLDVEYTDASIGASFFFGYEFGVTSGAIGDRFAQFGAPTLASELYIDQVAITGRIRFAVLTASSGVRATSTLPAGDASFVGVSIGGGYEFRSGMILVTPYVGIGMNELSFDPTNGGVKSGWNIGWEFGALISYRIPSDVGPHLDLSLRLARMTPGLGRFDDALSGSIYSIAIGLALVQRPYVRP